MQRDESNLKSVSILSLIPITIFNNRFLGRAEKRLCQSRVDGKAATTALDVYDGFDLVVELLSEHG